MPYVPEYLHSVSFSDSSCMVKYIGQTGGKGMKTSPYRDACRYLDEYRGKVFEGRWPSVSDLFRISVIRYPDNPCFQAFDPDVKLTYREADAAIERVARALCADGFAKGDRIAVTGHNSAEWVIVYFAVIRMGGIIVPLDPTLKDREMESFISFGGVTGLFVNSERLAGIDSQGLLLRHKYSLDDVMEMDGPMAEFHSGHGEETAAILFTSGTTGVPKGVVLSHDNLVSDCLLTQSTIEFFPSDVFYAILPLHHAYTMMAVVYMAVSNGCAVVFGRKLAMSHIFRELKEGHVTIFMAVPMLYNKMIAGLMDGVKKKGKGLYCIVRTVMRLSGAIKRLTGRNVGKRIFGFLLEKLAFENIRVCISGGGPLPASTFRMFNELGIDFVQGYGLTEASPVTHLNPISAFRVESVGRKFPEEEVRIVDPDSDGNGLIHIKGPMVMKGYYRNPEATAEVLSDGWLNTGDVGHQDKDGYLYLTGRKKNVIVTEGGKNVFPEEVEDPFQLYGEIAQVCVFGYLADKEMKREAIRILIVPSSEFISSMGGDRTAIEKHMNDIVTAVNRNAASHKRITRVDVVYEALPMTGTKKVRRGDVIEKYGDE